MVPDLPDLPDIPAPCPPVALDVEMRRSVLVLSACLNRSGKIDGPAGHAYIARLLSSDISSDNLLRSLVQDLLGKKLSSKSWDLCLNQADKWLDDGIQVAESTARGCDGSHKRDEKTSCPVVFFFRGILPRDLPWLAVFNSRKPRSLSPDTPWLEVLRFFLNNSRGGKAALASGTGTLTYDLVSAHAVRAGIPLVRFAAFSILEPGSDEASLREFPGSGVISCLFSTHACPRERRLVCRDRDLAALSNVHAVVELRSGGNLERVLTERQSISPVPRFVFSPAKKTMQNAGNFLLLEKLEKFPRHCRKIVLPEKSRSFPGNPTDTIAASPERAEPPPGFPEWDEYLFHYTRSCVGPWPGQSKTEYLFELLDSAPFSGHTALDTLARILKEARLRGGYKLVRGTEPVISWSSHPPSRFWSLRKWNPGLVRWTVEPYGIAISRGMLRKLGAKPAIYGTDEVFKVLREIEKFRFQLSRPGRCDWRSEREWRLRGDLNLDASVRGCWFAFVPGTAEKEKLLRLTGPGFPVVVFG